MKIALLCPVRERMNHALRLIESIKATSDCKDVVLYLGADEDDPTYKSFIGNEWVKVISTGCGKEFLGLGKIWNNMVKYVPDEIFAMVGTDMVFETPNWDKEILKEFGDNKLLLVHCNDGMRGPGNHFKDMPPMSVAPFIHRHYYDTLGYYVREEWKHGYHDVWLQEIFALMHRIKYRHDIMIRHLHISSPTSGAVTDAISNRLCAGYGAVANPQGLYDSLSIVRTRETEKLLCSIRQQ